MRQTRYLKRGFDFVGRDFAPAHLIHDYCSSKVEFQIYSKKSEGALLGSHILVRWREDDAERVSSTEHAGWICGDGYQLINSIKE